MGFVAKTIGSLPAAVLAATLALGAPQSQAQGLFDILFGGGINKSRRAELPRSPRVHPPRVQRQYRKAVPAPKITGPSYYTYKADPLVRVDFTTLTAAGQTVSFEPSLTRSAFREATTGLADFDLYAEKDIAKALADHYSASPEFIWVTGSSANNRAREAVRVLSEADSHGLSPADYAVTIPGAAHSLDDTAARQRAMVRFEMAMSARVLRYVRDAQGGRIDPNRLSGYHDFPAKPIDLAGVLKALAYTTKVRAFLESRHPQSPEYQALRVELEALRASSENEIVVDAKLLLKPGQTSPELPKLLQLIARNVDDEFGGEYGETLWRLGKSELYSEELVPVIKAVQEKNGLKPDGVIGPRTVATLAGASKADRLEKVTFALEQLRWLPSDLGSPRVFINQPAYTASYIEGGQEKLNMRVVIGKPSNQTSFFYDEIEQVDYNPYWGVPQSIIVNEMLPRLRRDPGYLDRSGYEVTDSRGRRIPSSAISWGRYGAKVPYSIRQTPSEANALGELKILFPNKHAIYMHDTPQKALFDRDSRAFSHGCVRLNDPRGMAAAVLGTTVQHIEAKLKQGHSSEKVTRKIPVYVAYFTAWPDINGKIEYFGDVYDRDARLKTALEKTDELRASSI
ncbi:L,D-transpeptidase family protein [Allomesorhizobium camelthorni]|uniref:Murein L,D-transpeptidase n=1 Tax=Allomesorhizobium camelthorni TaxID=475069 RepID=A0A6G4WFB0_9HYPH|nr:murein L,D-transpeptidase [Mesorhizobium camelthorni]NGO53441.1 murein L,D-transpeptidase [Mesorhizobium camelthorni]